MCLVDWYGPVVNTTPISPHGQSIVMVIKLYKTDLDLGSAWRSNIYVQSF